MPGSTSTRHSAWECILPTCEVSHPQTAGQALLRAHTQASGPLAAELWWAAAPVSAGVASLPRWSIYKQVGFLIENDAHLHPLRLLRVGGQEAADELLAGAVDVGCRAGGDSRPGWSAAGRARESMLARRLVVTCTRGWGSHAAQGGHKDEGV